MRLVVTNILFFFLTVTGYTQTKTLTLFQFSSHSDTSLYLTIQQSKKGISFVFPIEEGPAFYVAKNDSTFEKRQMPSSQSTFGPYKFKRVNGKILFQDKNFSSEYRDLYEFSVKEHFSPDLFSSSTDSYSILNKLMDSSASLLINNTKVPCYKFFQTLSGHNSVLDKYYRIVFIDKANLLPCRIETYTDKGCRNLQQVTFIKTYEIL